MADRRDNRPVDSSSANFTASVDEENDSLQQGNQYDMFIINTPATITNLEDFCPENTGMGGASSSSPHLHTHQNNSIGARPEVGNAKDFPDLYKIMLQQTVQNNLLLQNMMQRQPAIATSQIRRTLPTATETMQSSQKRKRVVSPEAEGSNLKQATQNRDVVGNTTAKSDNYESRLNALFNRKTETVQISDNETEENDSDEASGYSDISEYETDPESDTPIDNNANEKVQDDQDNQDNVNVLELMKKFIDSEDKSGPKINSKLAELVNEGLRTKSDEKNTKELSQLYAKPGNVNSLKVPRINPGVWKQLSRQNKDTDVKLQRVQNLMAKAFCPLLYLLDTFLDATEKQRSLSKKEVVRCSNLCMDTYHFMKIAFTDITYR